MKFQNFIVLEFAKQPIGEFKIYKRRSRRASIVLPLCKYKRDKILATRKTQPNVIKLAVKSTSATSKMSVKTDKYKQSKSSRTSHA